MLAIEPLRAMLEFARMRFADDEPSLEGDGHTAVFFPGLGADHRFMDPLADYCRRLGYECRHWGRGFNTGPAGEPGAWLADLAAEMDASLPRGRKSVTLVGWSLGGLYAREIAKTMPQRVRQVVTLGTPVASVSSSTNVQWLFELLNGRTTQIDPRFAERLRAPPPVPTTSIYSRSDGIVAWRACLSPPGPLSENIEVESSHLGLIWHPDVRRIVADRLAQPAGAWQPWRATRRALP
jgi:pimeloyl-ACP methyl ester carboxylesterase